MSTVYDAGVLIAADRNDRAIWADHRARLELGLTPTTTAPVVAQVSRSSRQAQLRRFLRGCIVADFAAEDAHEVGALLARARQSDVVDAHVILTAARHTAIVLTSDPGDLEQLSAEMPVAITIRTI